MKKELVITENMEPPGTAAGPLWPAGVTGGSASSIGSDRLLRSRSKNGTNGKQRQLRSVPGAVRISSSPKILAFRKRFFPETTDAEWDNWRWQIRNRIRTVKGLECIIKLSEAEREANGPSNCSLPLAITPYYAGLLNENDPSQPLRRSVVPVGGEYLRSPGESEDPLGEEEDTAVPGLVHRYADRVLFLVTNFCSTYCRYCTRSRMVGKNGLYSSYSVDEWEGAIAYIEATPTVRDVLLSGGDPLTLPDEKLEWLLSRLSRIAHVEIVRIGTKAPVVLPQRVTPALVRLLKRYHPLMMSIHFTHPEELAPEVMQACERLADAGIPLGSQTVLLAGVNDDVETLKTLFLGLLRMRVRPYYLYQCDPILGSAHFRTRVSKGLEVIQGLRGHTSGYAVPHYVIDAPGGGGKIPLLPETVIGRDGDDVLLRNYEGGVYRYPDAGGCLSEPCRETAEEK